MESPIPLSDIESVLEWVDTFKLSRPTKKINRDFSDAVLLAEILSVHYPKLVEMHNYPPRNSHSLKLNNWLTLNRKVLKKLKLNLCINTMEQLANCANGVIERVLIMVRDKIRRDEDLNKSMKDAEQNMSSGGSYYEACGDEENVLVIPVKTRVNGVLETVQQKVVSHESYLVLKEELKDARDSADLLKQKVEHLDNLIKLKDERIDELQKQLDRKQVRRKEAEAFQNSLQIPFETVPSPVLPNINENQPAINLIMKTATPSKPVINENEAATNLVMKPATPPKPVEPKPVKEESKIPVKSDSTIKSNISKPSITEVSKDVEENAINLGATKASYTTFSVRSFGDNHKINLGPTRASYTTFPVKSFEEIRNTFDVPNNKPHCTEVIVNNYVEEVDLDIDRIKSDVFKEIEIVDDKVHDYDEFKDSVQDAVTTIEQTIQKEIKNITNPMEFMEDFNC